MKQFALIISTLLFALTALAASPLIPPKARFLDANGNPLAGGKVHTYEAGTTTPLATYTDAAEGTPNANPVVLDANGEANIWLDDAAYKIVLKNSADVTQWTVDNFKLNVGTNQIEDLAVTAAKLAANSVTTAKILDANVTLAKLASDSVNSSKIVDASVSTADIAAAAVTSAKLATLNYTLSASCGSFSTTSSSLVDVTNLSAAITVDGRFPVRVVLVPDGTSTLARWIMGVTSGGAGASISMDARLAVLKGGTKVHETQLRFEGVTQSGGGLTLYAPAALEYIDFPSSGTHTYSVQLASSSSAGTDTAQLQNYKLLVYELK